MILFNLGLTYGFTGEREWGQGREGGMDEKG
jgi:hypothetical protein